MLSRASCRPNWVCPFILIPFGVDLTGIPIQDDGEFGEGQRARFLCIVMLKRCTYALSIHLALSKETPVCEPYKVLSGRGGPN